MGKIREDVLHETVDSQADERDGNDDTEPEGAG